MINWNPGEDFGIRLDDKIGGNRTKKDLELMVKEIKKISNEYGFDLLCYGSWKSIEKVVLGELGFYEGAINEIINNR